ncbi:MAG TPA: DUF3501 family protein [Rudaea sp.]|nr:DUF3501 family protein [Rudaea sp.]
MNKLTRDDLLKLEDYARERPAMRARVLPHKKSRSVHIGPNVTLVFEDRLTIQYQIQEMLRIERIFEVAGIQEELDTYNALIPDDRNLKATMLIEYPDPDERARMLVKLHGIEHVVSLTVGKLAAVVAVADEDLQRSTDNKTSAVHFLRFELSPEHVAQFRQGAEVALRVDHPAYAHQTVLSEDTRRVLAEDFD